MIQPDPLPSDTNAVKTDKLELDKDVCIIELSVSFLFSFSLVQLNIQVDCVISALDLHISYIKILKAATYLNRPNVLFIATNDDASLPQSDEIVMPGN